MAEEAEEAEGKSGGDVDHEHVSSATSVRPSPLCLLPRLLPLSAIDRPRATAARRALLAHAPYASTQRERVRGEGEGEQGAAVPFPPLHMRRAPLALPPLRLCLGAAAAAGRHRQAAAPPFSSFKPRVPGGDGPLCARLRTRAPFSFV